jgi:hypothetical protein
MAIRAHHQFTHDRLDETIDGCSRELLTKQIEGATTNPIGAIYAHALFVEDQLVQGMLQGAPPLFVAGGWAERVGVEMPGPTLDREWALGVDLKLEEFRGYAASVREATDGYLDRASDAELERMFDLPQGSEKVTGVVNSVIFHLAMHTGEIAALKGVEGIAPGFPFL